MRGETSAGPRQWAREVPVRDDVRAVSRFPATDYADSFEISITPGRRTSEQWARAVFEDAPVPIRLFLAGGWRALGLRLGPSRSARHVLGWRIAAARPDTAVLEARSAMGITARLVLQAGTSSLLFATFVRSDGLAGRVTWSAVAPLHRLVVPRLLAGAARRASQA